MGLPALPGHAPASLSRACACPHNPVASYTRRHGLKIRRRLCKATCHTCMICCWLSFPCLARSVSWLMFCSSTAAKRSLVKLAPDGSLNAFPSAVMIFVVFAEEPLALAAMESCRFKVGGCCHPQHLTSTIIDRPGSGKQRADNVDKIHAKVNLNKVYVYKRIQEWRVSQEGRNVQT